MKMKDNNSDLKHFIQNILVVDIGLLIVAGFISLALDLNFGVTLFFLGVLVGGIGAFLGGPDPFDPDNPRNLPSRSGRFSKHPVQDRLDQISYDVEHSVPRYTFENIMAIAGLIAIVLSLPFVISIMFSK